jgi:hypothetical protein
MNRYQKGKIYKIYSFQTNKVYIGATIQPLSQRISEHKSRYKRWQNGKHHYVTSFDIIKHGDAKIVLLQLAPCNTKEELHAIEYKHICENDCVNKVIPTRTIKKWRQDNKEKIKQYKKQYREDNKEKINKKHECECGGKYTTRNIAKHRKTQTHIRYVNLIEKFNIFNHL